MGGYYIGPAIIGCLYTATEAATGRPLTVKPNGQGGMALHGLDVGTARLVTRLRDDTAMAMCITWSRDAEGNVSRSQAFNLEVLG